MKKTDRTEREIRWIHWYTRKFQQKHKSAKIQKTWLAQQAWPIGYIYIQNPRIREHTFFSKHSEHLQKLIMF